MCFGSSRSAPAPQRTFDDSPPVVTGTQTGIENPKDTKKATEELRIEREKKEGFYNPGDSLQIAGITKRSGGNKTAQQKKNLAANRAKSQSMAKARIAKKKSFSNKAKGV